jgi:hypothetical protein
MFPDDPSLGLPIIVSPWIWSYTHTQCHADQGWGRKDSCFHISLLKETVSRAFDLSFLIFCNLKGHSNEADFLGFCITGSA